MAIINITAGMSLQTAVNAARPSDTLNVEAGATFVGPIELPTNVGDGLIVMQSSKVADLPQGRVNPTHAPLMPRILCTHAEQAVRTKPGAHHWKLDGIEVLPDSTSSEIYDLVRLGGSRHDQKTVDSVPQFLIVDRCYIHGLPLSSFQRGITLNSMDSEVTRSWLDEIHGRGMDSQAIASWNTPGRNRIVDCHLEAAGENFMTGGADPFSSEFIPRKVQVLRCTMHKPLAWRGKGWTVKNLLELKLGEDIVIDGCILENNWGGEGQSGIAVLFTVRNQEGTAPYSIIRNIIFTNNTVRNTAGALNFLGTDNEKPSAQSSNVIIRNNVFDQISGHFLTLNGFHNVVIERNTHWQICNEGCNTMELYEHPSNGFVYRDNVNSERPYGIHGDGGTGGKAALDRFAPGAIFTGNVTENPYDNVKLPGNEYPVSIAIGPDYRHAFPSKGADIDALLAAQSGVVTAPLPIPAPAPTPSPTPVPTPTPQPPTLPVPKPTSPDGVKGDTVVDASGNEWTFGPKTLGPNDKMNGPTLRNGIHADGGSGSIYKWLGGIVYAQGTDDRWYKWMTTFWSLFGVNEPGVTPPAPTPLPAVPVPSPISLPRSLPWPKQEAKQNQLLDAQWKERYFHKKTVSGVATFEKM